MVRGFLRWLQWRSCVARGVGGALAVPTTCCLRPAATTRLSIVTVALGFGWCWWASPLDSVAYWLPFSWPVSREDGSHGSLFLGFGFIECHDMKRIDGMGDALLVDDHDHLWMHCDKVSMRHRISPSTGQFECERMKSLVEPLPKPINDHGMTVIRHPIAAQGFSRQECRAAPTA